MPEVERRLRPAEPNVLTVSQLTNQIKELLETAFARVWVGGEISNFSRPQSGHCYLTLKDEQAQLRAVIWRSYAERLRMELRDGMEVVCRGALDLYAPRGSYQLVIDQIQPLGLGAQDLALRKLRERLAAEGLFDPARKRRLPPIPQQVAIVTSPTGAAIHDFLKVLNRRWPTCHVLVLPVRVQGTGAAAEIAAAIRLANLLPLQLDCLVVARGGGSTEDLWAYNEELVVRAIHASRIPVVSAIGHEIDVTLADLAADLRALTPTEAAERIAPSAEEFRLGLSRQSSRLLTALRRHAELSRARLELLSNRRVFRRPFDRVLQSSEQLDELQLRAAKAIARRADRARSQTAALAGRLESLSPLAVLKRGYCIMRRAPDNRLVRSLSDVEPGDQVTTRLLSGEVLSRVEGLRPDPSAE